MVLRARLEVDHNGKQSNVNSASDMQEPPQAKTLVVVMRRAA